MTAAEILHPAIKAQGLTKKFGEFTAVNRITIDVLPGEIFGFLGPNGSGKTTTIKMLAGLLLPDEGHIEINGADLATHPLDCKRVTGYIPDRPYLFEKLTGMEFLSFMASLYRLPSEQFARNAPYYLGIFDLIDWQHHLIESYSHGMRQKLIMASVFMLGTPVIIVDEPMIGLDPKSARIVKELFKKHARLGGSVFLSTHSLEIAEELCDRIAILVTGKIRALGDLATLRQEARLSGSGLEEIFLELTGTQELQAVIAALRENS